MEAKGWKLLRCIYDEMGQYAVEGESSGEEDNQFEKALAKDYGSVGWIIGQPIKLTTSVHVRVILEGEKEILEYILKLIRMQDRAEAEAHLNQCKGNERKQDGGMVTI